MQKCEEIREEIVEQEEQEELVELIEKSVRLAGTAASRTAFNE
ncbi:hypothetical protein [Streptomyces purpurascens]